MRFRVGMQFDVLDEVGFACPERCFSQSSPKQFITQPDPIRVHNIALAVVGNLANFAITIVFFDFTAMYAGGFSGQTHYSAEFMESCLTLSTERREHVAQVNGILGVA